MRVLSLFDGISCGMVALERAGIVVEKIYMARYTAIGNDRTVDVITHILRGISREIYEEDTSV